MSTYASPDCVFPAPLTSADIASLFGKRPGWCDPHRVRKRLNAKGFRIHSGAVWVASARPACWKQHPNGFTRGLTLIERITIERWMRQADGYSRTR